MADLGMQEQMTTTSASVAKNVRGDMSVDIRGRHLVHTISDLADRLIRVEGVNPRGIVITVTTDPPTEQNPHPDYHVVATAPLHDV